MNYKKCPQCKNLILINAPTCLHCGRPNKFITKDYINKKWKKNNNKKLNFYKLAILKNFIICLIIFLITIIIK